MSQCVEQMSPVMTSHIFLQGAGNGMDLPLMEILGTDVSGPPLTSPKRELQAVEVTKVEPVTPNFLPTFSVMPCMRVCHLLFWGGEDAVVTTGSTSMPICSMPTGLKCSARNAMTYSPEQLTMLYSSMWYKSLQCHPCVCST